MDLISTLVRAVFGFRPSGGPGYPCYWCGVVTTLFDAERFHVCAPCQEECIARDHSTMKAKYPLAGKDERNTLFFEEERQRHIARAKRLTKEELQLIIERGAAYDKDSAQMAVDGKTMNEDELDFLGHSAEQYIDEWG